MEMLKNKMKEGRNNIVKEKYVTLSLAAPSIDEAYTKFTKMDTEISTAIKRINNQETAPMTAVERLEILAEIYSDDESIGGFYKKAKIDGKILKHLVSQRWETRPHNKRFDWSCIIYFQQRPL